ncbi:MAG: hypothetical protein V1797_18025, partial [Pseudomonadota bacterium]
AHRLACTVLLAGCLAAPWGARPAQAAPARPETAPPPAAAEPAPAPQSRSPQAYYVPEQEDVEEWSQSVGGPAPGGGWGWLGRLFRGKPSPQPSPLEERTAEDDQAP